MNESIRLTKTEIDTIVMGCAYNLTTRTINYNKARVASVSLGRTVAAANTPPSDPNAEQSAEDQAQAVGRQRLTQALSEIHTRSQTVLDEFPKKLALGVGIQSRLLSQKVGPTGVGNFTFTADECAFVTDALRTFEQAEVDPITNAEIILAHISRDFDGETSVTESARQTKEEIEANQSRRDDFICLMAKVINYGKSLSGNSASKTENDQ